MNYLERPARRGFVIVGEDGAMEWEGTGGVLSVRRRDRRAPQTFSPPAGFERNDMFLDEMRHVLAVLAAGRTERPHSPGRRPRRVWPWSRPPSAQPGPAGSSASEPDHDPFDLTGRVGYRDGRHRHARPGILWTSSRGRAPRSS